MTSHPDRTPRGVMIATAVLAVAILVPSLLGFANKLMEFVHVVEGDADGAFALTPIVNYLLASAGFLCLLIGATLRGMFHDIEAPKRNMLEQEQRLDSGIETHVPVWAGGTPRENQP